jgi:O-succinylbenzoate synthase
MMETSVGIAAGLALARALPELPLACGLATLDRLAGDVARPSLAPSRAVLRARVIVPEADLLDRYADTSQEASR